MKEVIILDSKELSCPSVLILVFKELCGAYLRRGYTLNICKNIYELRDNSIIFMGNFFHVKNPCKLLYSIAPNATYIGWYWHSQDTTLLKKFIHIYENILADPPCNDKISIMKFYKNSNTSIPLYLRANDEPELIGTYERNIKRDYCYMGYTYGANLVPGTRFNGLYLATKIDKYMTYEERKIIYLSSIFALGFQSDENIKNEHVSQRIYEGLAYGCIVLTNSMPAVLQTDCIAIYIQTKNDIEKVMDYYKLNPDKIKEKQSQGYEFVKKTGTNVYSLTEINKICEREFKETIFN